MNGGYFASRWVLSALCIKVNRSAIFGLAVILPQSGKRVNSLDVCGWMCESTMIDNRSDWISPLIGSFNSVDCFTAAHGNLWGEPSLEAFSLSAYWQQRVLIFSRLCLRRDFCMFARHEGLERRVAMQGFEKGITARILFAGNPVVDRGG
jgi:hypothetical protein